MSIQGHAKKPPRHEVQNEVSKSHRLLGSFPLLWCFGCINTFWACIQFRGYFESLNAFLVLSQLLRDSDPIFEFVHTCLQIVDSNPFRCEERSKRQSNCK